MQKLQKEGETANGIDLPILLELKLYPYGFWYEHVQTHKKENCADLKPQSKSYSFESWVGSFALVV